MKSLKALLASLAAFGLLTAWAAPALAFECPKQFKEAQATIKKAQAIIDKIKGDMKGMEKTMSKEDMALVHTLWDDAKMFLAGAKHNWEKPTGQYDCARALGKAKAAHGFGVAADILHWNMMRKK